MRVATRVHLTWGLVGASGRAREGKAESFCVGTCTGNHPTETGRQAVVRTRSLEVRGEGGGCGLGGARGVPGGFVTGRGRWLRARVPGGTTSARVTISRFVGLTGTHVSAWSLLQILSPSLPAPPLLTPYVSRSLKNKETLKKIVRRTYIHAYVQIHPYASICVPCVCAHSHYK